MKIAYVDCFSGISGDMFLAALLDAGLPLEVLQDAIEKLHLPEKVELRLTETHKGALRAANLEVIVPHSHHRRHLSDILGILSDSRLSEQVKQTAARIFTLLAEAEARVHGEPVEQVHFHEVGALDSIVDITGAAIGLEALGIERLYASPLPYGSGMVNSEHGQLPLPAPATLEVLRLAHAPLIPSPAEVELVTPTGAAILGTLATFERPALTITGIGVGAGKRDLAWPNVMRLLIGEAPASGTSDMVQLETNIDDMNPQFYGYLMEKLFAAGAKDVFLTPIQMKKNRPGTLLGVIANRRDESTLAELILRESTTLGLRVQPISRYEAQREFKQIQTIYGNLTVKQKLLNGKIIQSVPEYDECIRLANENGVSLKEIY
ncbi:MAG TPA: nickel pincer cofactor biosynthesis protein LarC, partial [Anaerolineales bacterium]|nr:nickel pincer cofactor biosynthesis protein LarC [Anaerolineales bacterium]